MKAIGLIRVSTLVQDLQQQADVVKSEMLKDGYVEDDIILIQDKESAVKLSEEERNGLNKLKEYIENDSSINCVYVYELSRISRRLEVLTSIRDFLISHHVQLIVLKPYMRMLEADGTLSTTGTIMFSIFSGMSEIEGYLRKERVARGKKKVQLEGKSLGNWLPLGYTTDSERHIIIDEDKAELVRKIFRMCVYENKSTKVIARELSETGEYPVTTSLRSHSSSILNILRNTAYIGVGRFNTRRNKENFNQYPQLIDTELFNSAQSILSSRKQLPKTEHKNIYYCKGLLRDKNSGYYLKAAPVTASYILWSDKSDIIRYKSVTVPINLFDSFAWHLTKEYILKSDTSKIRDAKKTLEKREIELKKKLDTFSHKLEELFTNEERIQIRIVKGKISESLGDRLLNEVYSEMEDTKTRMNEISKEYHLNTYKLNKYLSGEVNKEALSVSSDTDKFNLIHDSIKEILVEKGGIPVGDRIKRIGVGNKYGIMSVKYDNEIVEEYKFNSYSKKCYRMDDTEVVYEYTERIKSSQVRKKKES